MDAYPKTVFFLFALVQLEVFGLLVWVGSLDDEGMSGGIITALAFVLAALVLLIVFVKSCCCGKSKKAQQQAALKNGLTKGAKDQAMGAMEGMDMPDVPDVGGCCSSCPIDMSCITGLMGNVPGMEDLGDLADMAGDLGDMAGGLADMAGDIEIPETDGAAKHLAKGVKAAAKKKMKKACASCSACGASVLVDAKFCGTCGAKQDCDNVALDIEENSSDEEE